MTRNRLFLLAAAMLTASSAMQAQTSYEAAALLDTDLGGTARFVGMGGAMGALGADISTMGTNPAGIGLYRSWDLSMSFGGNWVTQRTQSNSTNNRSFDSFGSMDNAGLVITSKVSNENVLRFVNFGFNYRNVKRFGGKMGMASNLNGLSQTGQMAWQAWDNYSYVDYTYFDPQYSNSFFENSYYRNENYGWLTLLGFDADLMGLFACTDENGDIMYDEEEKVIEDKWYTLSEFNKYSEHLSGGIDAYDFNLSFNLLDAVYLGVTLTTYDVDRLLESSYSESFYGAGGYTLENYYRTTGTGYDFKLGVILRPFEESSFRVGVSATTPAVYKLCDSNWAVIRSEIPYDDLDENGEVIGWHLEEFEMDTRSEYASNGDYCYTNYTMIAPAKLNISLGGTIGTSLALGAEYEYSDNGAIKLYEYDGRENSEMNDHTAEKFTAQHTLRLGVEKMFSGSFYTRFGYNYQTGGYKADAKKMIPINSVQTNTAYKNVRSKSNYTLGVGFRGDTFYADAALLYSHQKADFFPFDDPELEATSLNRNLLKGMVTVGLRF